MSKPTRIPKKLAEFIAYITLVNTYLHETLPGGTTSRGIHLGMTTAQLTALDNFVTSLVSGDHANPAYGICISTKTPRQKKPGLT